LSISFEIYIHRLVITKFFSAMRSARRKPGSGMTITEERIKALGELGFDWVLEATAKRVCFSFQQRVEQLKAYKETHSHVIVKAADDKKISVFSSREKSSTHHGRKGQSIGRAGLCMGYGTANGRELRFG